MEGGGEALVVALDGKRGHTRNTWKRFGLIRKSITAVLRRRQMAGWEIEVVLGHCTYYSSVCREFLSVFYSSYAFIQTHYDSTAPLWDSVRGELRAFRGLMVLAFAHWDRPWSNMVYSTDASEDGFGITVAEWDIADVGLIGRVSEKSRWKLGAERAREGALVAAGFIVQADGRLAKDDAGKPIRAPPYIAQQLLADRWETRPGFPDVPSHLLKDEGWRHVLADPWKHKEEILILEARAIT